MAGLALRPSARAFAIPVRSTRTVASFAPPLMSPDVLRTLARRGIEAAVHAGAQFADLRVSDRREYRAGGVNDPGLLSFTYGYGIRVRVNGGEAFVCGADPTPEGIVQAAQQAVVTARAVAAVSAPAVPLVLVPAVTGEWQAPIAIDPFAISPDEHVFASAGFNYYGRRCSALIRVAFGWESETRVFASSEGTLLTQGWTRFQPRVTLDASNWRLGWHTSQLVHPGFVPCTAGFEAILGDAPHTRLEAASAELEALMRYPFGPVEVGRGAVVLDGHAAASLLSATLVPALSLERVLGDEQDIGEGSFLAPPTVAMGEPLFAPHLHLAVEQGMPHFGAMQWDDEGVATTSFPLIEQGAIVNYLGTRASLAEWTHDASLEKPVQRPRPPHVPGCAFALDVMTQPSSRPGALTMHPVASGPSLADLIKTMQSGYLVRNASVQVDQGGAGGILRPHFLFEVRRGAIVRRVLDARLEFSTRKLLAGMTAVGNAETVDTARGYVPGGVPWSLAFHTLTAPAVQCRDINIAANPNMVDL